MSNTERSEQFVQTQTFDNRTYAATCHASFYMQVYYAWQPVDSYQLMQVINAKKRLLFITLPKFNFYSHRFF